MNVKLTQWGRSLLLGLLLAAPAAVFAEQEGEHDDATARRKAMAEWYNDDLARGSDGGLSQKQALFSPEYQRFLNEAAKRERERHAALMPYSGTSSPVTDVLAPLVAAANGNWLNIGPTSANYAINGGTLNVTDAGRVNAIVTDPANANVIYVAFSGGGVWKSTDNGSTWAAKTETLGSLSVGTLAMAPDNANTLYLGLGDPFDGTGMGLVKSTDGGDNWGSVVYLGNATIIPAIEVARTDTNIVLAGTNAGLYRSTNGGASFSKVTIDPMSTTGDPYVWSIAWGGGSNFVLSLEADHNNASYQTNGQIWRSTDNGATWARSSGITDSGGITRLTVAAAPSNRNVMYVEAANNTSYTGGSTDVANFFKSTDNGVTWTGVAKTGTTYKTYSNATSTRVNTLLNGQGWYNQVVLIDPTNADVVYFGGALTAAKTTDGGGTYAKATDWLAQSGLPYVHADFHAGHIASNGAVYFGTDGGIFRSTNNGSTFTDTLNRGIASHLIYQVGSSVANRNAVVAGLQDNGTRVRDGNTAVFNQIIGGDGFGCNVNRSNASQMLGSLYYSRIYKSTNGGTSFSQSCSGITECNNSSTAPFITRIAEWKGDPSGNTLFTYSNAKVYKSTNYASNWAALGTSGLPTSGLSIRNIGVAASSANTIGVVANSGRAYLTTNGGTSWTQIGSSTSLPGNGLSLSSITFDPANPSIIYIASVAPDAQATHLWRSANGGTSWTAIDSGASGFPAGIPVNSLIVDPLSSSTLYAATHLGVYTSDNSGATWTRYGAGMPLVNVTDLYVADDGSLIRAATFGRSVWEYVPSGNAAPTANFTFTTNGLTAQFTDASSDSDGTIASWAWTFGDGTTSTQQNPSHTYAAAGSYTVTLTATDDGGATNTISKPVTVATSNVPPTANFGFTTTGLTANFTDGSTDSDGSIASRSWTFGDGATSTATNPSHTYAAAGTYSVTLTVTDNLGATDSITKPVTVAAPTFTVTPSASGNGTISPSTPQTVNQGATTTFTLSPAPNYHVVTPVGGTCGGTLAGNTYTTNAVNADCTVIASFAIDTHAVTPSVNGGNGTISPSTAQTVNHGATTTFTLSPAPNYHVVTPVGGTCGRGDHDVHAEPGAELPRRHAGRRHLRRYARRQHVHDERGQCRLHGDRELRDRHVHGDAELQRQWHDLARHAANGGEWRDPDLRADAERRLPRPERDWFLPGRRAERQQLHHRRDHRQLQRGRELRRQPAAPPRGGAGGERVPRRSPRRGDGVDRGRGRPRDHDRLDLAGHAGDHRLRQPGDAGTGHRQQRSRQLPGQCHGALLHAGHRQGVERGQRQPGRQRDVRCRQRRRARLCR
ncbi:MAG: PKD domain-containing protein [Rhodanobacteraceae bacterium]|nr:PKD domain-containing protein [Rhodanobacteraceae bacterium]